MTRKRVQPGDDQDMIIQVFADTDLRRKPYFWLRLTHGNDRLKRLIECLFTQTAKSPKRDAAAEKQAIEESGASPRTQIFIDRHGLVVFRIVAVPANSGACMFRIEAVEESVTVFRAVCGHAAPFERPGPGRNRLIVARDWPGYWEIYLR